jgi:hypothetical protein
MSHIRILWLGAMAWFNGMLTLLFVVLMPLGLRLLPLDRGAARAEALDEMLAGAQSGS